MPAATLNLYISNMPSKPAHRQPPVASIRTYSLFGETADMPDILHVEPLSTRSSLHGWEMAPHRHARLHQLLLLDSGSGTARLEQTQRALVDHSLVNVPVGQVHAFSFVPGAEGWVAMLPDELLSALTQGMPDLRAALSQPAVLTAGPALLAALQQMAQEFLARQAGRALVLRGLAATALALTARSLMEQAPPPALDLPSSNLLQRFETLLQRHSGDAWPVARYAQALSISPTHLSRLTRQATGHGANHLIEAERMREARRLLAFTAAPVKAIAYELGFADPAHFCRAFKRSAGRSPRDFRQGTG